MGAGGTSPDRKRDYRQPQRRERRDREPGRLPRPPAREQCDLCEQRPQQRDGLGNQHRGQHADRVRRDHRHRQLPAERRRPDDLHEHQHLPGRDGDQRRQHATGRQRCASGFRGHRRSERERRRLLHPYQCQRQRAPEQREQHRRRTRHRDLHTGLRGEHHALRLPHRCRARHPHPDPERRRHHDADQWRQQLQRRNYGKPRHAPDRQRRQRQLGGNQHRSQRDQCRHRRHGDDREPHGGFQPDAEQLHQHPRRDRDGGCQFGQ